MAKLKMLKLPKKPKKSASLETKQKFLAKVKAIQQENVKRNKLNNESKRLDQVISGIGSTHVLPSSFSARVVRPSKRKHHTKATGTAKRRKRRK